MTVLDLRRAGPERGAPEVKAHLSLHHDRVSATDHHLSRRAFGRTLPSLRQAAVDEESLPTLAGQVLLTEVAMELVDEPLGQVLMGEKGAITDCKETGTLPRRLGSPAGTARCADGRVMATKAIGTAPVRVAGVIEGQSSSLPLIAIAPCPRPAAMVTWSRPSK
jgi:hypothetical protein